MGVYLNPGRKAFEEAVHSEIFVDKTEMIQYINSVVKTKQKYISVSRPRRFGKTMAADMIAAYYDREADSREMFKGLKLAGAETIQTETGTLNWDAYLGKFDVIRLVMTRFFKSNVPVEESLAKLQQLVVRDLKKAYPETDFFDDTDLLQSIEDVYSTTTRQLVVVIDEWDAVFRVRKDDKEGQTAYLGFLRDLMKDNAHIALAYMTGILPIKKYGEHSALNMFDEYSMMNPMQLAAYTGFVTDEVQLLCEQYGRDFQSIKNWYDGYDVSDVIPPDPNHEKFHKTGEKPKAARYSLYSPLSVVKSISTGKIINYWNKTETYEALAGYIRKDFDGLQDAVALLMDGGRLKIDTSSYQNDMTTFHGKDDVLSLLVHLGYLGFDDETSEVFVPNREILDEFKTSTKSEDWLSTFHAFDRSLELVSATWNKDEKRVAELIEEAHDRAANNTYHDESALSYAIQLAYYAAQKYYTMIPEADTGKGYADLICIPSPTYPDKPALVVELKYNKDAHGAISQIRERNYPERLEHYKGNILLVGINYDRRLLNTSPGFKHHACVIEEA